MSLENKIELLWEGAKTLENGQQAHKLLKSYYINTCRKLAKNSVQIPKEKFAISQMCQYCGSFWNDSEFGLKLEPKQIKSTSRTKKLIEKFEKSANGTTSNALSRKQKNRAKWLKKKISNNLAIKCCLCKHKSVLKMVNVKSKSLVEVAKNNNDKGTCSVSKRVEEEKMLTSTAKKSKMEKVDHKPIKNAKFKNKPKSNNKTSSKVISKTQNQNSLLQLAALLQRQSKTDLKNSTEKKLKSFLK